MKVAASMSLPRPTRLAAVGAVAAALLGLSACGLTSPLHSSGGSDDSGGRPGSGSTATAPSAQPSAQASPIALTTNLPHGAHDVPVDHVVRVRAAHGTISTVSVTSKAGRIAGRMNSDGTAWRATQLLEPGTTYDVVVHGTGQNGRSKVRRSSFTTQPLTLDQQTYPSVSPLGGQTVGIGMPVVVRFDVPVHNRALFEKHMSVTSQPAQKGAWHWISDNEVHWRPKTYWKAGTKVQVHIDVNSLPAGNGIYGQEDRDVDFAIGAAHIYKVNMRTDQMQVFSGGKLIRTLPVTTGKVGFTTRSGIKVIESKTPSMEMSSASIGIPVNSVNGYDIKGVLWAMRLTNSGEFIHAAPWSEADQGSSNVSHGCTGLSTADAEWLYDMSQVGDVVQEFGTSNHMTLTNGFGDWNLSWKDWKKGSAL
jgi:lipoprotein-anchoring transpeptidase ErfK/SrfK